MTSRLNFANSSLDTIKARGYANESTFNLEKHFAQPLYIDEWIHTVLKLWMLSSLALPDHPKAHRPKINIAYQGERLLSFIPDTPDELMCILQQVLDAW